MAKTLLDVAYDIVSKQKAPITFAKLWELIKEEAGLSDEEANKKVARFYTNLMLDGRFVNIGDNTWDLRSRQCFDKVHIDMRDVYTDMSEDSDEEDEDEDEEDKAYKKILEGGSESETSEETDGETTSEESSEEPEF